MELTTADVADIFGVTVSTVNRWVQLGHLESERFGTGRTAPRVFRHTTVTAFGEALTTLADQPKEPA